MSVEEIMEICQSLKGVKSEMKWEDHLCFTVGEKIFLLTSPDEVPPNAAFKVTEEDFIALTERAGIGQARYFAKRQWVLVENLDLLDHGEWESWIEKSYRLVSAGLTRKKRTELGIE